MIYIAAVHYVDKAAQTTKLLTAPFNFVRCIHAHFAQDGVPYVAIIGMHANYHAAMG